MDGDVQEHDLLLPMNGKAVQEGSGSIRQEVEKVYAIHTQGDTGEALCYLVDGLVRSHPSSLLVFHLLGDLYRVAGDSCGNEGERLIYHSASMLALTHTAELVPRCLDIAAGLASVLASLDQHDEVESECERTLKFRDPLTLWFTASIFRGT